VESVATHIRAVLVPQDRGIHQLHLGRVWMDLSRAMEDRECIATTTEYTINYPL
jgi:hypothetical protein